jgi:arabinose-5-phosphate isomerase
MAAMKRVSLSRVELREAATAVILADARAVASIADQLSTFDRTIEILLGCTGKVIAVGSGTSAAVAQRLAHLLSVTGQPAFHLSPSDALHGSLGAVVAGDVLIAISKGGATGEVVEATARARERGAVTIAVTARPESPLARAADHVVTLSVPLGSDPGETIAMGSTVAAAAWGDAVALVLMRIHRYAWRDLLFTHPAGLVGQLYVEPEELDPLGSVEDGPTADGPVDWKA